MADRRSRRSKHRIMLLVVSVGAAALLGAVLLDVDSARRQEILAVVGVFTAIATLIIEIASRRPPQPPPPDPIVLADDLARTVRAEWLDEAKARMLRDPGVLPLSWAATHPNQPGGRATVTPSVADAKAAQYKDAQLPGSFDEAARQLAAWYDTVRTVSHGRLVTLGEPGAGKTALAILLTIGLLEKRVSGTPTPVLLSAGSWDPVVQDLDDWMITTLGTAYYNGRCEIPRMLLERDLLLPILDGLDEIPESARRDAVGEINRAVGRDRPVVVTCRSAEYEDVVKGDAPVLRGAPVVQVLPVPVDDVIEYLEAVSWPAGTDWSPVFAELRAETGGPLARALSTPLMVSVARTVYQRTGADPAELLRLPDSRHAIEDHLIGQLIDAAYTPQRHNGEPDSAAARIAGERAARARRWLIFLALHLHQYRERDLAWWQLSQRALSVWVGPAVGIGGGMVIMTAVAAAAVLLGRGADPVSTDQALGQGLFFGAGYLALAIVVWYAAAGRPPSRLSFTVRGSLGRLRRGFATGVVLVTIAAVPLLLGMVATMSLEGWTFRYLEGLFVAAAVAITMAGLVGTSLAVHNWLQAPPERAARADPLVFLRQDRRSSLIGAAAAGAVVVGGLAPCLYVAMAAGGATAHLLADWPGAPGEPDVGYLAHRYWRDHAGDYTDFPPPLAILIGGLPGVVFGLVVLLTRAWPRFVIARAALAVRGHLPWRLMAFLADARQRQLLRQSGGVYQFRHVRLQERLARQGQRDRASGHPHRSTASPPSSTDGRRAAPADRPVEGRTRRRRLLVAGACVLLPLGGVFVLAARLPADQARRALSGHDGTVYTVRFSSPVGRRLVSSGYDGTARLWDPGAGRQVTVLKHEYDSDVDPLFSPDGRLLVTTPDSTVAELRNANTGQPIATLPVPGVGIRQVAFSPDGAVLAVASDGSDGGVGLWDATTGRPLASWYGRTEDTSELAFSPDGQVLATASYYSSWVWLRDPRSGERLRSLQGHTDGVTSLAFSPDGLLVVTVSGQRVRLWRVATGELLAVLEGHTDSVDSVTFSPDGSRLVTTGSDYAARLWDTATGEAVAALTPGPSWVSHVQFSPDGRTLIATADDRDTVGGVNVPQLWDAKSGDRVAVLSGHERSLNSLLFAPDGETIVSSSDDGTVRFWDGATGAPVGTLTGHVGPVKEATFTPDGRTLATAGDDSTVRLWDTAAVTRARHP